tara:strand:- start:3442 stop:3672 length:231 start_codon:yes stop_codon:yes gene_type:complete
LVKYANVRVTEEVIVTIIHDLVLPVDTTDDETLDTVEEPEIGGRAASSLMLPGVGSGFEDVRPHKIVDVEWSDLVG